MASNPAADPTPWPAAPTFALGVPTVRITNLVPPADTTPTTDTE